MNNNNTTDFLNDYYGPDNKIDWETEKQRSWNNLLNRLEKVNKGLCLSDQKIVERIGRSVFSACCRNGETPWMAVKLAVDAAEAKKYRILASSKKEVYFVIASLKEIYLYGKNAFDNKMLTSMVFIAGLVIALSIIKPGILPGYLDPFSIMPISMWLLIWGCIAVGISAAYDGRRLMFYVATALALGCVAILIYAFAAWGAFM